MIREYVAVLWNPKERVSEDVYVEVKDDVKLQNTLAEAEKKALAYAKEKFGWSEEETICISLNSVSLNLPEGRKIIGTCKECKWWLPYEEAFGQCLGCWLVGTEGMKVPYQKDMVAFSETGVKCNYSDDYFAMAITGEDFGCIHWERREKRKE